MRLWLSWEPKPENKRGFVERSSNNFVPDPTYRILSMSKKQKSVKHFLYFDRKWPGPSKPDISILYGPRAGQNWFWTQHRRHNVAGLIRLYISSLLPLKYSLGISDTVSRHIAVARDSKLWWWWTTDYTACSWRLSLCSLELSAMSTHCSLMLQQTAKLGDPSSKKANSVQEARVCENKPHVARRVPNRMRRCRVLLLCVRRSQILLR